MAWAFSGIGHRVLGPVVGDGQEIDGGHDVDQHPHGEELAQLVVGQAGALVDHLGQHLEGAAAAAGDVRVARGGGKAVQLDLEQLGVLHELDVGGAHGLQGLFALEALADRGQLADDPVADQVVGGDEQVLLGAEQAEQVGLGDPGPPGDGLGGGPGVAGQGEFGDGRGQHGGATLVGGLSARNHHRLYCECSLTNLSSRNPVRSPDRGQRVASIHEHRPLPTGRRRAPGRHRAGLQPGPARLPPRGRPSGGGQLGRRPGRVDPPHRGRHRRHLGGLRPRGGRPGRGRGRDDDRRRPGDRAGRSRTRHVQHGLQRGVERHPLVLPSPSVRLGPPAPGGPPVDGGLGGLPRTQRCCSPRRWPRSPRKAAGCSSRTTTWP